MVKSSVAKSESSNIKYLPKVQKQDTNSVKKFEEFLATKINDIKCSNNDEKTKAKENINDENKVNKNIEETSDDKQDFDKINSILINQIKAELENNNPETEGTINQTLEQINLNKEMSELTVTLKETNETCVGNVINKSNETRLGNFSSQLNEISLDNETNQLDSSNEMIRKDDLSTEVANMSAIKQGGSIKERLQDVDNVKELHEIKNAIAQTNARENTIKINEQQKQYTITSGKGLPPEAERQIIENRTKTYTKENTINMEDALIKEVLATNNQDLKQLNSLKATQNKSVNEQEQATNYKEIIEGSKLEDESSEQLPKKADGNIIKEEKAPFFSGIYSGKESAISTEINKEKLVNQVGNFILKGHSKGENNFTVRLFPEGLGQIKVELKYIGSKLEVKIMAEKIDTSKVLTEQISQLKKALGENSIDILRVDVEVDASYKLDLSSNQHRGFEQGRDNNKAGSQNNQSNKYNFDGVNDSDFQNQEEQPIYYDRKQILNYIV